MLKSRLFWFFAAVACGLVTFYWRGESHLTVSIWILNTAICGGIFGALCVHAHLRVLR